MAEIEVAFTGAKKDNAFTVNVTTTQGVNALAVTTYTFVEPAADKVAWLDQVDVDGTIEPVLVVAKNTNFTLNFAAIDTYKAALTAAGHTVQVSYSTTVAVQGTVTDGKAAVTYPGFAADGTYELGVTVLKNGAVVTGTSLVKVKVGTAGVPATVSITDAGFGTSTAGIPLSTKDFKAADTRLGQSAPTSNNGKTVAGTVKDANGNVVAGASVTVAGTDLQFNVADTLYVADSVTVLTNANGAYSVTVYSNKTGKKTVTVTSGAASKTQDIHYAAAAYSAGTALTVTTTATGDVAAPGTTVRATVKLVDKYGNPVKVKNEAGTASFGVKVTGPGFVSTLPAETDSSGEAMVSVLLGSQDSGSLVFTATYDADDTGTEEAPITVVKSIAVQVTEAVVGAVIGSFKGRWAVRVENATGSTIAVKAGGKWYKYVALNDNYLFSRKSRVGATIGVTVYVNGSLENTETITVK
jgi:trimeric autotransporter adhesin